MRKQLQTIKNRLGRGLAFGVFGLVAAFGPANAQTYLTENFDGTWSGTPAAPSGWTQERIQAANSANERDWAQNTFTTVWSSLGGTLPTTASPGSGASALWIDDLNFAGTATAQSERRMISPTFDLTTSTSPYVRFWYFNNQGPGVTLNVRVVISTDGGATWVALSNVVNGFNTAVNTWNRINIPIPASLRSATTKIGIAIVNRWGSNNPFIDDVTVEEFTPTTITSAAAGDWNATATWAGGVIPTADNHVVIAHNVVVTNTASTTGIVARCQNLTVDPAVTLSYGAGTANLLHVYGDVTINGTFNSFNGVSGRIIYVGGDFTIGATGTANFTISTTTLGTTAVPTAFATGASSIVFTNAKSATFTNNGTLTSSRINNIIHLGSGLFTYNSPVSVPFTFGLYNGTVNPNANLTLGNAGAATTNTTVVRAHGSFTTAPIFNNTNVTSRNVAYISPNMVRVTQTTYTPGEEIPDVLGTRTVTGTLALNTQNHIQLGYPVTVGTATTGGLTLSRGILITSATNLLTLSANVAGSTGATPSTTNPNPTTHGSYIVGPLRINFPATGTTTRNFPLGLGTSFNSTTAPTSNVLKLITINAGATAWAGQTITATLEPAPTGSVTGSLTAVTGVTSYRLNLNGGPDLSSTATVAITGLNRTFGNSDNLVGNERNIFIAQSLTGTSGWSARSVRAAAAALVNNTTITRTSATATPGPVGPLSVNGEYFALANDTTLMSYSSADIVRNIDPLPIGASTNQVVLRVKVTTVGLIPIPLTALNLNTTGTNLSGLANLTNAKVWYTGASTTFSASNQFGATAVSPSGAFTVTGSQSLIAGDNYFWVTYDIGAGALVGDVFAAECASVVVSGITQTITAPPAGTRDVSVPMTYTSSTVTQNNISRVFQGTLNQVIVGVEVVMSSGAPVPLSSLTVATTGTTSLSNITNLRVYYTGTSATFASINQFGTTVAVPAVSQTVTGTRNLAVGTNYFWVTYDVTPTATVTNLLDAEVTSITVDGLIQTPIVTAPAGSREIRAAYCNPTYTFGKTVGDLISRIRILGTSLDNNTGTAPVNPSYEYFSGAPNLTASLIQGGTYNIEVSIGSFVNQGVAAWIDYNDDGVFSPSERIGFAPTLIATAFGTATFPVSLTCASVPGVRRLRVRGVWNTTSSTIDPCLNYGYGEVEDYDVTITLNPLTYQYSAALQQLGSVTQTSANKAIFRIPIYASGCDTGLFQEIRFTTSGTTLPSDISAAKLYKTGNSPIFNTNTQIGSTVTSPSGSFSFIPTVNDTIVANDTTNYWLTYDISPTAVVGNVVDATIDSLQTLNNWYVPSVTNPAGNRDIGAPITYLSSTAKQPVTAKIDTNTIDQVIGSLEINVSPTGVGTDVTNIAINTNGTNNLANISNIKVWYTGNNAEFSISTQFGATITAPAASHSINGSQQLNPGKNYFWFTYSIPGAAVVNDSVDIEVASFVLAGITQTPIVTAPAGNRKIGTRYCLATHSAASNCIDSVVFGGINRSTAPAICAVPSSALIIGDTNTFASVLRGATVPLTVRVSATGGLTSAWIDYNDNGVFEASEFIDISRTTPTNVNVVNVTIPCTAVLGQLRMRIRTTAAFWANGATDACTAQSTGETEEYYINVLDNPATYVSSTTIQSTGVVAPGAADVAILRIPVRATGCGVITATSFNFNTTGTTLPADITNAKLYYTGNSSTFSIANLRGAVASPSGLFSITLAGDTLLVGTNDTNNYWLAYDVNPSATFTNVIDAELVSVVVGGNTQTPVVGNPAGNVEINAPMTYLSSTAVAVATSKVETGSTNNPVVGLQVVTSAVGSTVFATSIDLNLNGVTDTANIQNIKVWYTGNSSTFATTTQFGTTQAFAPSVAAPYALTVTGSRALVNGNNYFWVTYDVKTGATVGNFIDGEITSVTVAGIAQIPAVSAPTGNRQIRAPYCATTHAGGSLINNIQFGTINNSAAAGATAPWYRLFPQAGSTTTSVVRGTNNTLTIEYNAATIGSIWIDFNDNGTLDTSEWTQLGTAVPAATPTNFTISIPCSAVVGDVRMRVRTRNSGNVNGSIDACTSFGSGEAHDYTITILDNPLVFNSTTAIQQTGAASPGTLDRVITRIPIRVNGCGTAVLNEVRMSTTGTTNNPDIVNAKLYRTAGNTFNTSNLRSTIASPVGQFTFGLTDTIATNDTTNYWLAYDVNAGATLGNVLDATLDSILVLGNYQVPTVSNPSGNVQIDAPMTYVGSTVTQASVAKVTKGVANNAIIGIQVTTSAIGSPINLTSLNLNLNGTTDTADIQNIKVWYTGSSSTFATSTQFGSTQAFAPAATAPFAFTVTGSQALNNGTNYFWVTYDIKAAATSLNVVDGECASMIVGGTPQTPSVTAPIGNREIVSPYCASGATNAADEEIFSVTVNGATNTYNCTTVAPGPGSILNRYSNFTTLAPLTSINHGQNISFTVVEDECDGPTYYSFGTAVWVDWNQDGDFDDAGEEVFMEPAIALGPRTITGSFTVPLTASIGETRMRITVAENLAGTGVLTPCLSYGFGETEDYTIVVNPVPPSSVYTWNQTSPADYTVASNWTPSRTSINLSDKLRFNGGGNITVTNVPSELLSSITVDNLTNVTLNGGGSVLTLSDSLALVSGNIILSSANIIVGTSPTSTGTVISGPGRVRGGLTRWIAAGIGSYGFPISNTIGDRLTVIDYTTAPTAGGTLTVNTILSAAGNNGLPLVEGAINVNKASVNDYRVLSASGISGGAYSITANADNTIGVTNVAGTVLVQRTNVVSPWTLQGTHVTSTGTNIAPVLTRTGVTVYEQWALAADSAVNPLPVTLTQFTATPSGKDVQVTWTTASELNNRGFDVERSLDGRTFEKVTFVKGAGNSNKVLNYNFTDKGAFTKSTVWFYRLRQIDFDGKFAYSAIVRVNSAAENVKAVSVSPNPYTNNFNVSMVAAAEGNATIELMDVQGRLVSTRNVNVLAGANEVPVTDAATLRSGVYFVRVSMNGETQVVKLVKE